ncbi:MAG: DNA polymerase III subunit epsilon [Hyphomonadaceae bacterium]|jgi:DNA polymerase-3 subunit epsilon|nr:DNA polymerase III subunit epsilon [Hyphomonadaceae bacterium]MBP9234090.1 DNA polymerase III subunit epsilon [Hyphomonadaceae bacterium]
MREVVFDTETTGLDPRSGDRIVEVGCIELRNYLPTGREFQIYINPGRPVSEATVRITGITNDTLRDKKRFEHPDVVDALMAFLGEDPIVAHNAEFDRGFLNYELELLGRPHLPKERFIDTLVLAREHRPGSPASLDAVCKRFNISIQDRVLHGALLDAQLLAMAYLELRGGRERAFDFASAASANALAQAALTPRRQRPAPLTSSITPEERAAHDAFIGAMGEAAIWKKYA